MTILYQPTLHEKGWSRYSENAFTHEFNSVFKTEEAAIAFAQQWLDIEYSQEIVRIPKDLAIDCNELYLAE